MRIGILGGTFNPVHIGHLIMAENARQEFRLDKIVFIPCAIPPHKHGSGLPQAAVRLQMLEAALAGNPAFEASDIEMCRGGKSYSLDTVRQLRANAPARDTFFFLIGADSLEQIMSWHRIRELMKLCQFIVVERPGLDTQAILKGMSVADRKYFGKYVLKTCLIEVSSRQIRQRVRQGKSIRYLVNEPVEQFIAEAGLYRRGGGVRSRHTCCDCGREGEC